MNSNAAYLPLNMLQNWGVNPFRAAGGCRRHGQKLHNFVKNVKIIKHNNHIENQHAKCIQLSTNMPSIGLVVFKIGLEIYEECFLKKLDLCMVKLRATC